ncbi:MAG TPA: hypothetical protein VK357_17350 [Rubrobacteraceae bacterium]|nr:hypothetical protein [Rubrobacteraceae bacterium]
MKRVVYLAMAAMVAMLILVPAAMAQEEMTVMQEETMMMETTQPLPKSGGPAIGSTSVLLPAAALLLGSGVLAFAVLRRR